MAVLSIQAPSDGDRPAEGKDSISLSAIFQLLRALQAPASHSNTFGFDTTLSFLSSPLYPSLIVLKGPAIFAFCGSQNQALAYLYT
jgi:hypothetical protein